MKIAQLKRIAKMESLRLLNSKPAMTQLRGAMETACAFLNSKRGGTILVGVKNNGDIVGADISDKTQMTIVNEMHKIEPCPDIEIEYVPFGVKKVVVINVKPGTTAIRVRNARLHPQRINNKINGSGRIQAFALCHGSCMGRVNNE